jgi:transposase
MTAPVFCEFLKRLIHNAPAKIFLILDGHPVHRSLRVKKFVQATKGKLRLFYLPPYSPELNPDELVWNNVKGKIGRSSIKGPDDFQELGRSFNVTHLCSKSDPPIRYSGF